MPPHAPCLPTRLPHPSGADPGRSAVSADGPLFQFDDALRLVSITGSLELAAATRLEIANLYIGAVLSPHITEYFPSGLPTSWSAVSIFGPAGSASLQAGELWARSADFIVNVDSTIQDLYLVGSRMTASGFAWFDDSRHPASSSQCLSRMSLCPHPPATGCGVVPAISLC